VDGDSDLRLSRRVVKHTAEYGRSVESALKEYVRFVKPAFDDFILPVLLN
jgi:uridine kinase